MVAIVGSSNALRVERISSLAQLAELGPEWDCIQRRSPEKHVLLDHRWVYAWLKAIGKDKQLHILVLRAGGTAVGIVPLIISSGFELFPSPNLQVHTADDYRYTRIPRFVRWIPVRRLSFPLSVSVANRRAHFMFVEHDPRFYALTVKYVESIVQDWDLMVLEGFPEGSPQEELLMSAVHRSGLRDDGRRFDRKTLFASLPGSMDRFLAAKSRHFRKRMKASCRQSEARFPDLRLREFRRSQIDEGMDRIFALEKRSWKASDTRRRVYHIGPDPLLETFHREAAQAFAATDNALVLTMDIGERSVAGIYCVEREGVVAAIITFMDQEFSSKLSAAPMFRGLVERSIGRGMTEIDFNGNTVNIAKWANKTRASTRLCFYNRRPYSRFLRTLSTTAHRARGAVSFIRSSARSPGASR